MSFIWYNKDINLVNNTILDLCKSIEKSWGEKYIWIWTKAQKIFDSMHDSSIKEWKKIDECSKFYDKYGDVLIKALYGLASWSDWEDAHLTSIMFFEEKEHVDKNWVTQPWNANFHKYLHSMHSYAEMYNLHNEDFMNDAFYMNGLSGPYWHHVAKDLLGVNTWWQFKKAHAWPTMWKEIVREVGAISNTTFIHWDTESNIELDASRRKDYLKNYLKQIIAWILINAWTSARELWKYNSASSPFSRFNDWGIYMPDFYDRWIGEQDVLTSKTWDKVDLYFDTLIEWVLNYELNWIKWLDWSGSDILMQAQEGVKSWINTSLHNNEVEVEDEENYWDDD